MKYGMPKRRGRKPKLVVTAHLEELAMLNLGSPARIARQLREEGVETSRWSVMRAFDRAGASNALLAAAREGENGLRRHLPRFVLETRRRNECWQADCSQLPIEIVLPSHMRAQKAWITVFLDAHTRAIMGYAITVGSTTAASVLVALHSAIRLDEQMGPFSGLPNQIVYDGGKQYLANAVTQAELTLGITGSPRLPYTPIQKGKWSGGFARSKKT